MMSFLGGLLPTIGTLIKPVLGSLGGVVKSTIGDMAPKLLSGVIGSGVQTLTDKLGITDTPEEMKIPPVKEQIKRGVDEARETFKRKAQDVVCQDELRKMRKLEAEVKQLEKQNDEMERQLYGKALPNNYDYELQ